MAVETCPVNQHPADIYKGDAPVPFDGASTKFPLRNLSAPDASEGGHANVSLWLGTDGNIKDTWVEAVYTRGYEGDDAYYFVMAHQWKTGPDQFSYFDLSISLAPVVGHSVQFSAYKSFAQFAVKIHDLTTGSWHTIYFNGHALPVNKYWVGGEYTCPGPGMISRIDRTYVWWNQYRRESDNVWFDTTIGLLVPSGTNGSGMAWCESPRTFRFWLNSTTPTSGCW